MRGRFGARTMSTVPRTVAQTTVLSGTASNMRPTPLRARSGVGRMFEAVPESTVVCATVRGTVDIVRAPKRPRIEVEFYRPDPTRQDCKARRQPHHEIGGCLLALQ